MNRFVIMVDAGYLLRQGVEVLSERASSSRSDIEIPDTSALMEVLLAQAHATLNLDGKELLRIYWYDGVMSHGFTSQQKAIMQTDDVQFRAGTIDWRGQQKGVDALIVNDLIELATYQAICDAVLITGDGDLVVGMEQAQRRGVRVAVLGVEDAAAGVPHHQSFEVTTRADRVGRLGHEELSGVLRYVPNTSSASAYSCVSPDSRSSHYANALDAAAKAQITAVLQDFVAPSTESDTDIFDPNTNRIDAAVDKSLLQHVSGALGHKLSEAEKVFARYVFRKSL